MWKCTVYNSTGFAAWASSVYGADNITKAIAVAADISYNYSQGGELRIDILRHLRAEARTTVTTLQQFADYKIAEASRPPPYRA